MRAGQVALLTAGAAVTGVVGYAVYFDYMRRNSPEFRKGLRKQQKKIKQAEEAKAKAQEDNNNKALAIALVELELEQPPTSPEAMEAYFTEQVALAEALAAQGPEHHVKAATHFYRALRVYPQPVELLMIYQKVCPEPVFNLVIKLTQLTSAANAGGAAAVARTAAGQGAANVTAVEEGVDDSAPTADKEEKKDEEEKDESAEKTEDEDKTEAAGESESKEDREEDTASHPSSGASWEKVHEEA